MLQAIGVQKISGTGITTGSECALEVSTGPARHLVDTVDIESNLEARVDYSGITRRMTPPGSLVSTPASSTLLASSGHRSPSASEHPRHRQSRCKSGKMVLPGPPPPAKLLRALPMTLRDAQSAFQEPLWKRKIRGCTMRAGYQNGVYGERTALCRVISRVKAG